jgi:DNA mismatch endonuclease (patch repair protein)
LSGNQARDLRLQAKLRLLGWKVGVIWECQTKKPEMLEPILLTLILHPS